MSPYRPAPLIKIKQARKEQISNYYSDFDFVEAAFCGGDHTLTMPFERIFGRPAIAPAFCDSLSTTFRYTTYLKPGRPWIAKPFGRMILEALYRNGRGPFLMHGLTKLKLRIVRVRRLLWYRCDRERPLGSGMLLVVSLSCNVVLTHSPEMNSLPEDAEEDPRDSEPMQEGQIPLGIPCFMRA